MTEKEKIEIIKAIDAISKIFESEDYSFIKPQYRKAFQIGQLDALLTFKELLEDKKYKEEI